MANKVLKGVQIISTKRIKSSVNGNPRYLAHLDNGDAYRTGVDSSCGFGFENKENLSPNVVDVHIENGNIVFVKPSESRLLTTTQDVIAESDHVKPVQS